MAEEPIFCCNGGRSRTHGVFGFAPTFYLRSTFNPDKDLSIRLHIHGFALSAWIVLFLVQTILIVRGSPTLHRRLGWVMSGLAASIVVLMGAAIVDQMQRTPPPFPAAFALAFGMFDMIVFATLVGWAIYWRKRPDWHKRLMLTATILLLVAEGRSHRSIFRAGGVLFRHNFLYTVLCVRLGDATQTPSR